MSTCGRLSVIAFALLAASSAGAADLLVTGWSSSSIAAYDPVTGALDRVVSASGANGMVNAHSVRVGPDADLYVTSTGTAEVLRFDGATDAFLGVFADPGAVGATSPADAMFGPDGHLYVSSITVGGIFRFDGTTGAFLDTLVAPGANSLNSSEGLSVGPDGLIYVCSGTNGVKRYDTNGAFMGNAVPSGSGGLSGPHHMLFMPNGHLLVDSFGSDEVLEFDVVTRTFVGEFVTTGSGGVNGPHGMAWGPDGNLYVASFFTNQILKYSAADGSPLGVFASTLPQVSAPSHLLFRSGVTSSPGRLGSAGLGFRSIRPNPATAGQRLDFALGESRSGTLRIYDAAGRLVRRFDLSDAEGSLEWNGRDGGGRVVPAGVYFVRLETDAGSVGSKLVRVR